MAKVLNQFHTMVRRIEGSPDAITKVYLENVTEKKCITILRQFIKSYHYKCMGIERSIQGKKQMTYRLLPMDKEQLSPTVQEAREYVIDFSV